MNASRWLKVLVVLAFVVPLVAFKFYSLATLPDTSGLGRGQILAFMAANGFEVGGIDTRTPGVQVFGTKGTCSIQVKEVSPQGWDVATMQLLAKGQKKLFYVYRGQIYAEQPSWRTWIDYRLWRVLRLVNIDSDRRTVFGVAMSDGCDGSPIDYTELHGPAAP